MRERRLLGLVIGRELYARRKAFIISTSVALVLVVGGLAILGGIVGDGAPAALSVGVVGEGSEELGVALRSRLEPEGSVQVVPFATRSSGEEALQSGSISALVVGSHDVLWAPDTPSRITGIVTGAMSEVNISRIAGELGLGRSDLERLLEPVSGESVGQGERDTGVVALTVITVILMFLAIIAYGQWIAYGVVEEKANRVAEMILGALGPSQLLTAKLISLGGLGLLQLVTVVGAGWVTAGAFTDLSLPAATGSTIAWLIVWFLLGFAFYGSLYAAAGSLAADTQEAGAFIGPLNFAPGIGYMVGVIAFSSGSTTLARVISLIPLWTPLLMPGRIAEGTAAPWEVWVSVIVMLLSTLAMLRLAARVYLGGITQATRRVSWRQAFRGGRDLAAG